MNETQAMPSPGTYFSTNNGNGSIADGLALASLRDGSLDEVTAHAAIEAKEDVWEAESEIQQSIQRLTNFVNQNNLSLHNRISETQKSAIEAKYESKLEVREAVDKIKDKVDAESDKIKDKLDTFRAETKDNFSDLERRMDKQFTAIKEREFQAEITDLRSELHDTKTAAQTQGIVSQVVEALTKK